MIFTSYAVNDRSIEHDGDDRICYLAQDCQLVVKVEDKDKLVGKSELGRCRIDLRELDFLSGARMAGRQLEVS